MNKKIKIIELLNKIANGEELPQKILIKDIVWYLVKDSEENFTYSQTQDNDWQKYIDYKIALTRNLNEEVLILDDEVEILEDNTEQIEELQEFDIQGLEISGYSMTQAEYLLEDGINENRDKINEIIRYIKRKDKNND